MFLVSSHIGYMHDSIHSEYEYMYVFEHHGWVYELTTNSYRETYIYVFIIIYMFSLYSTVCSGTDQWKHQNCASLAFVREIPRNITGQLWGEFPAQRASNANNFRFDDVIMVVIMCLSRKLYWNIRFAKWCQFRTEHWILSHLFE